jgi:dTDP-4-dehydrorhamnose 3,5-epimerase
MIFQPAPIPGVYIIEPEPRGDSRGMFARTFCSTEMERHGLKHKFVQCNVSYNYRQGTLRGLHWQVAPASECKLIRCTSGAFYDVIIDMRPWSPSYLQHFGIELSAANRRMLYIPDLFAHGYQALADNTEAAYQVTEFYTPEAERGVRYDDPAFAIKWPLPVTEISEKDRSWPSFYRAMELEQTA